MLVNIMSESVPNFSDSTVNTQGIKQVVKDRYGKCAETTSGESCCCAGEATDSLSFAAEHGLYSQEELSQIPELVLSRS